MPKVALWSHDHIPHNKTRSQVTDATCRFEVQDYDGSGENPAPWTSITLDEEYHPETEGGRGRAIRRTISMTLTSEQRRQLIDMLTRQEATE